MPVIPREEQVCANVAESMIPTSYYFVSLSGLNPKCGLMRSSSGKKPEDHTNKAGSQADFYFEHDISVWEYPGDYRQHESNQGESVNGFQNISRSKVLEVVDIRNAMMRQNMTLGY